MPGNYNRVILVGNLTRDPEMRYIPSGMGVVKFGLAVNRRTKTGDETTYVNIVAWDKLAEICNTYLKKGMSVLVEGRLSIRSYDDKEGIKRQATEIVIDVMQMLERKSSATDSPANEYSGVHGSNGANHSYPGASSSGSAFDESAIEDEIPF